MKKVSLCLALVAIFAVAQAAQMLTSSDLAAQASIEANEDMHPLNGNDVITSADFSRAEYEGLQALTSNEFWDHLESELVEADHEVAHAAGSTKSLIETEKDDDNKDEKKDEKKDAKKDATKSAKAAKKAEKAKKAAKKAEKKAKKDAKKVKKDAKKVAAVKKAAKKADKKAEKAKKDLKKAKASGDKKAIKKAAKKAKKAKKAAKKIHKKEKKAEKKLSKDKAKAKKDAKKAKKAGKKAKKAEAKAAGGKYDLTQDATIDALAKLPVPAEKKAKTLDDKLFAKDTAFEYVNLPVLQDAPANSTELIIAAKATHKELLKEVAKQGHKYMLILRKLRKKAKKYLEDEDFDAVKVIQKKIDLFEDKMDVWITQRDAMNLLNNATQHLNGWKDYHEDFIDAINHKYNEDRKRLVAKLRKQFEKYLAEKKADKALHMKAHALKSLRHDLEELKGDAMKKFVRKFRLGLYKRFGKKKIDRALKKDARARKKALARKKAGKKAKNDPCSKFSYLHRATKGKYIEVLVGVAAHLPTVGPYIRAGIVNNEAGKAMMPIIRRW